jgi:hypothetical protein
MIKKFLVSNKPFSFTPVGCQAGDVVKTFSGYYVCRILKNAESVVVPPNGVQLTQKNGVAPLPVEYRREPASIDGWEISPAHAPDFMGCGGGNYFDVTDPKGNKTHHEMYRIISDEGKTHEYPHYDDMPIAALVRLHEMYVGLVVLDALLIAPGKINVRYVA